MALLPFRGQQEAASKTTLPDYDPSVSSPFSYIQINIFAIHLLNNHQCYLCPGNKRAQGDINPKYEKTFVFVNDYSAVKGEQDEYSPENKDGSLCFLIRHQYFAAYDILRPVKPPTVCRASNWKMLCDHVFCLTQPHTCGPYSTGNCSHYSDLDEALHCSSQP